VASKEKASFAATIIGNTVIDLKQIETLKLFDGPLFTALGRQIFANGLNEFISLSKPHWTEARKTIQNLFRCGSPIETNNEVLA
jgi:fumarylacetoacetase